MKLQTITKIFTISLSLMLYMFVQVIEAQDNTLPVVTGEVTSPAKNQNRTNTTSTQNINDSGATGQSITSVRQTGSSGSSGDISVTTTNTINGDLNATNGTVVRVGDVNLSGSKTGSVTVRTTTEMKGGDFKDGGTHEFGVVDLMDFEGNKVEINSDNTLGGQVNSKNDSSVSIGSTRVGETENSNAQQPGSGNVPITYPELPQLPIGDDSTTELIVENIRCYIPITDDSAEYYGLWGGCGYSGGEPNHGLSAEELEKRCDDIKQQYNLSNCWIDDRDKLYYEHDLACREHGGCTAADHNKLAIALLNLTRSELFNKDRIAAEAFLFFTLAATKDINVKEGSVDALLLTVEYLLDHGVIIDSASIGTSLLASVIEKTATEVLGASSLDENTKIVLSEAIEGIVTAATLAASLSPPGLAIYALKQVYQVTMDIYKTKKEISEEYADVMTNVTSSIKNITEMRDRIEENRSNLTESEFDLFIEQEIRNAQSIHDDINWNLLARMTNPNTTDAVVSVYQDYIEFLRTI